MDEGNEIYKIMLQKLPSSFSFCPKCGSKFFRSQNHGKSYLCEECNFQYYINNSAAVACLIFNSLGELLLTRRALDPNKGMLDLPGGFVEPLERAEEAVVREIREELNLEVTEANYLISFPNLYPFSNFVVPTIDLAFHCKVDSLDSICPADDVASYEFILPDKVNLNEFCSESMKQIIQFYIARHSS